MLMLECPLYDFLATVPTCSETTTLAVVMEIFAKEQCDRLVVLNSQHSPLGMLSTAKLMGKLLTIGEKTLLNLEQPIYTCHSNLISPLETIVASDSLNKLGLLLRYPKHQKNSSLDWALIDSDGKFLGLLDSKRLLAFFTSHSKVIREDNAPQKNDDIQRKTTRPWQRNPFVQLLERLPWPLMLQTGNGEILTKNPAWWEQLGVLKDPEGIRMQVESILTAVKKQVPQPIHNHSRANEYVKSSVPIEKYLDINKLNLKHTQDYQQNLSTIEESYNKANDSPNYCYLDSQQGTCICVVEVQNGQERIWQFAKIPLDSRELKIWGPESQLTLTKENSQLLTKDLWLVLATDVTEQQQLFKELAAKNADLIQLNRLKDEFLACISHELKTPLTAVLGLSRLLVDKNLGELNERQARYAGLIHQSGRHLMSVVNDILDLTRMETGQMELTPSPVRIQEVCDRALVEARSVHTQTGGKGEPLPSHEFSLSIEPGLKEIVADELRLRQMLVHLLGNAFKFTESFGKVGLRVNRWEGWIAFTVWDTGIGIPDHQQHLIFQKFQQLENPLNRQFEGTGLGLVLTRALARLHGGDVSFLSREGKGSQFTLLLPPSPPKTSFTDTSGGNGETPQLMSSQRLILIVEAVSRYIEEITQHLKSLGYRVVIARSGTEALEKARRLQPKTIFLNPLLPLLSGWDVLTLLKSDSATRHIPVIITATGAEKEQAYLNRADDFLSLPVEYSAMVPIVERWCMVAKSEKIDSPSEEPLPTQKTLKILRLVSAEPESNPHPSLTEHRVIEVDDLEQAEILARVWQFDVILLDTNNVNAQKYLQQLPQYPRLAKIPLVTCDAAITLAASQIPGLAVFPCLTPMGKETIHSNNLDHLVSVLEIASGIGCPPNILVVDITMLSDLPGVNSKHAHTRLSNTRKPDSPQYSLKHMMQSQKLVAKQNSTNQVQVGGEWFQALIQYLQTAGFKAGIGNCWRELVQQIIHQSVDLILLCIGEATVTQEIENVLNSLANLQVKLPPILVLDKRTSHINVNLLGRLGKVNQGVATQLLPSSISMEDLLGEINQALERE
ncbi:ATP-binding protein [Cylindrospermopsis raciborskii]|uniref:ATP-binding protein n=1 Tax=Cylindrospermopsis raciborskii TaxID=77022 RepID=UPI000778CB8F|nr:ATP-binding protein [Cylindrospermopsis raciborskii]MCZ2201122.1 ATP-binding protein [Cylindrospermopsis raciborskii PAMP2012]MCZ2204762.1 ATP-binding protein [Cylindrospermopsis raciborskii PAMP2011]